MYDFYLCCFLVFVVLFFGCFLFVKYVISTYNLSFVGFY